MGDAASAEPTLGLGLFAAVDQAPLLDELPERETDAGRFLGIAAAIAQSVAPLVAAVMAILAGTVVLRICSVR